MLSFELRGMDFVSPSERIIGGRPPTEGFTELELRAGKRRMTKAWISAPRFHEDRFCGNDSRVTQ